MSTSPLLQQYFSIKQQYPEALLFFQVGDFYELFFEDAHKASAFLGITLTKRGTHNEQPVPLCGVPVHALDHHLVKLVKGGFRVVICDQLEPARPGKIVERGVKQVLTPGTLTDLTLLNEKSASYCAALVPDGATYGCVFVELLTGNLFVTIVPADDEYLLEAELRRFSPDEIILPADQHNDAVATKLKRNGFVVTMFEPLENNERDDDFATWLASCACAAAVMIERSPAARGSLQLLFSYLKKNQATALTFCKQIFFYSPHDFLMLDAATQRNLELTKNSHDASSEHSLFALIDRAITAMGSRLIKKWLMRPLTKQDAIEQRLDVVELFLRNLLLREELAQNLKEVADVERVVGRIALNRAHINDYRSLLRALRSAPHIAELLAEHRAHPLIEKIYCGLGDFEALTLLLSDAISDDHEQPWLIKPGYSTELDRLRTLTQEGAQAIATFEKAEQERTGIQSLKVRNNQVHGYAIEITKANLDAVPPEYLRMQTLVNRERFTTPALKDLEYDILRAQRDGEALEKEIYTEVCLQVATHGSSLRHMAHALAQTDALLGLATIAYEEGYTRPTFHDTRDLIIEEGKHPVVAAELQHAFIPNDTSMSEQERTWIITGPNMGGKSTFLRQVALICTMAHMGSFVPARRAQLPILDRIFTRIGAADNVAQGKSTFLVEMEETALICNQATEKSLVILDEVGRGTSTYDGLAIAQAVVEHLHTKVRARALFATHYHELTALAQHHAGIAAYHAASKKTEQGIMLLHKICKGSADGSFGIEVAKAAHIPTEILVRAQVILHALHQKEAEIAQLTLSVDAQAVHEQLRLSAARITELEETVRASQLRMQALAHIDYDALSPKQAFDILWELKR